MVMAPESLWLAAEPLLGQLGALSQVERAQDITINGQDFPALL